MDPLFARRTLRWIGLALSIAFAGPAVAEPPLRAGRLGYLQGTVSFAPAGQPDWVQATVNRPLTTGDRLWTDGASRAEVQMGGTTIRLGSDTDVTLLNLDDRIAQVMLSQGSVALRVRRLGSGQSIEVDTPNLAFTVRRAGEYRIDVDANDDATVVLVRSGEAEVAGEGASYVLRPTRGHRFHGTDLSDRDNVAARRDDDLDRWSRERDRRLGASPSARYVSAEVVGYDDLDAYGNWRSDPDYGNVWTPSRVSAGWTPFRDGHWTWIDPWGWTWVDDAPWGFAVSHYGRWAHIRGTWGWVPGPRRERAVYAPALVAFVGGSGFQGAGPAGGGAIGWFPLAPREVYRPSYTVSRGYFDHVNRSNAVIAPTTITNVYNTTIVNQTTIVNNTRQVVNLRYANQQVAGAVVAVPVQAFVQSRPVAPAKMTLSREAAIAARVARVAAVAPEPMSLHGGARDASARPPARTRAVVTRTAPPPPPVPFADQQKPLAARPGRPFDDAERRQLAPAAAAPSAPRVKVVAAAQAPARIALPPASPPASRNRDAGQAAAAVPGAGRAGARPVDEKPSGEDKAGPARGDGNRPAPGRAATADAAKDRLAGAPAAARAAAASAAMTNAARGNAARAEAPTAESARADMVRSAAARRAAETSRADQANAAKSAQATRERADEARGERAKAEAARADAVEANVAKANAARAEATRNNAARAEVAKANAAQANAARLEAARLSAERADASKAAAANAAKARAFTAEAAKADAAKSARARADANQAAADGARARGAKAEAARVEAVKATADRAAASKAGAARASAAAQPRPAAAPPARKEPAPGPKAERDAKDGDERRQPGEFPPKR